MRYLTVSEVLLVNEQEVGPDLLADFGLLEAAILRPQQSVFGSDAYPDMHTKAAAMMHSIIRNHAFIDGNKRTGVLAMILFHNLNGYRIETVQEDLIALALDIAEGQIDVEGSPASSRVGLDPFPFRRGNDTRSTAM
ncbi:MAG: type II toxin-antitoxin system death-on-curing family toxin [Acidobacteria bacterium]|nr:type II toxin-antitoxin system death-on-curing family toxin [Acidobacteriota bacterium]